jgi:hypothetical protein
VKLFGGEGIRGLAELSGGLSASPKREHVLCYVLTHFVLTGAMIRNKKKVKRIIKEEKSVMNSVFV